jgi:hypothetical protein
VTEKEEIVLRRRRYLDALKSSRAHSPRRIESSGTPASILTRPRRPPDDDRDRTPTGSPKNLARAFPSIDQMEGAHERNGPPEKEPESKRSLVMTGELYQIEVGVTPIDGGSQHIFFDAALDTCAGCNLIRANELPYGAEIRLMSNPPVVSAAQGHPVKVTVIATLNVQLPGFQHWLLTDFLVVDKLIVPAVLGTPWIDQQVISIFPKKKTILVHLGENMAPVEVPLKARTLLSTSVVRAAKSDAIPAFSETWISVRTNRHGLSVIQPKRNRDSLLQAKNALTEVPENGQPFRILVANFSEFPISIRK